jgi:hypothetical protein
LPLIDSNRLLALDAVKVKVAGLKAASADRADMFEPDASVNVLATFLYR